jgi:hypothetical protein
MAGKTTGSVSQSKALQVGFSFAELTLAREANMMRFESQLQDSTTMMDQSTQAFIAGEMALLTAQNQSNALNQYYNKTQQQNAVETASSNRSFAGGSVQAVMQGDLANLQYDTEFAKAIGQFEEQSYKRQSENYYKGALQNIEQARKAANAADKGAMLNFVGSLF